jgi:O-antigen/teichoic acid export membrane protein
VDERAQLPSRPDLGLHFRAARGAASNYAGQFVVLAAAVLLTPLILHHVGQANYSLWLLATSLTGYGGLLDLGISAAVQKYVAEHRARGTTDELSRIISTALALYGGLGLVAVVGLGALAPLIATVVGADSGLRDVAVWLVVLVGVQVAVTLLAAIPKAVLQGAQRFELANLIVIVTTMLVAGLTVTVLALGAGIVAVAAVAIAVDIVMQLPAVWLVRRAVPELRLDIGGVSRKRVRAVFTFSVSVLARRVADLLERRTDPFVIGAALPVRMITPFSLAQRLPEAISILTNQFVQVLLPLASELDARDERATLRALYLTATRVSMAFSLALGTVVAVLGPSILTLWVGGSYARYGYLAAILTVAAVVDTIGWAAASILTGIGRHRPLAWMVLAAGVTKVALSVGLVFAAGLTGVAVATVIPFAVVTLAFVVPYSLKTLGVRLRDFAAKVLLPNLFPALASTTLLVAARMRLDTDQPAVLFGSAAAALTVYLVTYLRFSAGRAERQFYRELHAATWAALTRTAR